MIINTMQPLLLSGSKALNVNGTTPKTFAFTASTTVNIIGISCLLKDEGSTTFAKFGALTGLTNGVIIQWNVGGSTSNYMTLKDNADLTQAFPHHQHFGNSAVLSILSLATPEGFGNTNNIFKGEINFSNLVILNSGDSISAIIQDDLSAVDVFQMAVLYEQDF